MIIVSVLSLGKQVRPRDIFAASSGGALQLDILAAWSVVALSILSYYVF